MGHERLPFFIKAYRAERNACLLILMRVWFKSCRRTMFISVLCFGVIYSAGSSRQDVLSHPSLCSIHHSQLHFVPSWLCFTVSLRIYCLCVDGESRSKFHSDCLSFTLSVFGKLVRSISVSVWGTAGFWEQGGDQTGNTLSHCAWTEKWGGTFYILQ